MHVNNSEACIMLSERNNMLAQETLQHVISVITVMS